MFDIGFSEVVLVFIVGLVVLGPQRLPVAIRTVMGWVRTIRSLATSVQNELTQELKLQELKESIQKAEQLNLSELSPELSKTIEDLKQAKDQLQENIDSVNRRIRPLAESEIENIQQKIARSEQSGKAEGEVAQDLNDLPTAFSEENELSADELAEQVEIEEICQNYYPPDDVLAEPKMKDKEDVS